MSAFLAKLKSYIPTNIAGILGIVQSIIKFVKEVCTLAIDLICPIIPGDKDEKLIAFVRNLCNKIDEVIEKIKAFLLKI